MTCRQKIQCIDTSHEIVRPKNKTQAKAVRPYDIGHKIRHMTYVIRHKIHHKTLDISTQVNFTIACRSFEKAFQTDRQSNKQTDRRNLNVASPQISLREFRAKIVGTSQCSDKLPIRGPTVECETSCRRSKGTCKPPDQHY